MQKPIKLITNVVAISLLHCTVLLTFGIPHKIIGITVYTKSNTIKVNIAFKKAHSYTVHVQLYDSCSYFTVNSLLSLDQ